MKKALVFILLISLKSFTQDFKIVDSLKSVTNYVDDRLDVKTGTSVIVTQNNKTIYKNSNGLSSLELGTKNTITTKYDLASIAKMFTGYAIASLELEGKIVMNDEIQTYLPDFPKYNHKITVGNLVHHTSGIKNWTYLIQQESWDFEDQITTENMLRLIYAQKSLDFIPGSKYQYSNSGYVLLAKIIEKITGEKYHLWMQENIFKPLKMNDTFFNNSTNNIIEKFASAYRINNNNNNNNNNRNRTREAYNTSVMGSSSLISNAIDMAKWMNFLLEPNDKKNVIKKMLTIRNLNDGSENNYAYGIEISKHNGVEIIGHDGSWASYTSQMNIIPSLHTGVFFANNFRVNTGSIMELYLNVLIPRKNEKKTEKDEKTSAKKVEKIVKNPIDKLSFYTGKYKLGVAWYLDIIKKEDKLYAQANGENAFYMKPLNDSTFLVRQYGNRTIAFKDNGKKSNYLVYNDKKAERKIDDFYFNKDGFKKYTGIYYSTELGILYEIYIKDDKIFYSSIKSGTFPLLYESENFLFTNGKLSKLKFLEDSNGNIIGFNKVNSRGEIKFHYIKAN